MSSGPPPPSIRLSELFRWFVPLLVLCSAWMIASPLFGPPDEGQHLLRASALTRGEFWGPDRMTPFGYATELHVRSDLILLSLSGTCFAKQPTVTPNCVRAVPSDSHPRAAVSITGRYPPLYYLLVSLPIRVFPSTTGVYLMRLISVLVGAAFLALAFAAARKTGRLTLLGVAIGTTPMVVYFAASVNPSGLELASAVAVWATAMALARAEVVDERLVAAAAISFAVCANVRGLSLPMAGVALVAALALTSATRRRELRAVRHFPLWAGVAIVSVVPAVAWGVLRSRAPDNPFVNLPITFVDAVSRTGRITQESIAWFGWFEVRVPVVIVLWLLAGVLLTVLAVMRGGLRELLVMAGVVLAAVFVPVAISLLQVPPIYSLWQGRYGLPLTVGVPILAGVIADTGARRQVVGRSAVRPVAIAIALVVGVGQVIAFFVTARRYAVGSGGPILYFVDPVWRGPPAQVLPLIAATAAILVLTAFIVVPWMREPGNEATDRVPVQPA